MNQLEMEVGETIDTPLGKKSVELVTAALKQYLDPNEWVSFHWSVDDVLSHRPKLTRSEALEVLHVCKKCHNAEIGISWDIIGYWADELFGGGK
jgi:hypothetical protein